MCKCHRQSCCFSSFYKEGSAASKRAIQIRNTIAQLGEVEVDQIIPNALFSKDLIKLEFWDSLDSVELLCALEEGLEIQIQDKYAELIPNPELAGDKYSVADFIFDIQKVIEKIENSV